MDKTQNKKVCEIEDFERQCHLWSIVPGGTGKGILLLRKIVDSIQANSYARPDSKLPSILIVGSEGKQLVATALVNSLAIGDTRTCHARYLENGITSHMFFNHSTADTAHIITNIEHLKNNAESVLWRYVKNRCCNYYNYATQKFDNIVRCNGLIVITAKNRKLVSDPLLRTDYIIELEPLSTDQKCLVVHQYLKFCGIEYDGEQVLQAVVGNTPGSMRQILQLLRACIVVMRAEHEEGLTEEIVEKAKRLTG